MNEKYDKFKATLVTDGCRLLWSCPAPNGSKDFYLDAWSAPRGVIICQVWNRPGDNGFAVYADEAPPIVEELAKWVMQPHISFDVARQREERRKEAALDLAKAITILRQLERQITPSVLLIRQAADIAASVVNRIAN